MLDSARYWMGVLFVITLPPAFLYWFAVHPWPGVWRRIGKWPSLVVLFTMFFAVVFALVPFRELLVGQDLGFRVPLTVLAVLLYVPAAWIARTRGRHLTFGILAGLPEIAPDEHEPKLLDQGIYARIRHPRYLEIILGITAWALFINHRGVYGMVVASVLALFVVIWLEERELVDRFGEAYVEYRRRVPMMIPRFGRDTGPQGSAASGADDGGSGGS